MQFPDQVTKDRLQSPKLPNETAPIFPPRCLCLYAPAPRAQHSPRELCPENAISESLRRLISVPSASSCSTAQNLVISAITAPNPKKTFKKRLRVPLLYGTLIAGGLLCLPRRGFSQAKAGLPRRSFSEGGFFDISASASRPPTVRATQKHSTRSALTLKPNLPVNPGQGKSRLGEGESRYR